MKNTLRTLVVALLAIAIIPAAQAKKGEKRDGRGKGMMMKHMLEKMDTDKDGKISKAEWQSHHEQKFTEIDANNDGQLETDEFKKHRQEMREKHKKDFKGKKAKGKGKGPKRAVAPEED